MNLYLCSVSIYAVHKFITDLRTHIHTQTHTHTHTHTHTYTHTDTHTLLKISTRISRGLRWIPRGFWEILMDFNKSTWICKSTWILTNPHEFQ